MKDAHARILINLGTRIRKLREKKQLDQKQFAFNCEISRTQLHLIERGMGNPRLATLIKIAEGLETTPEVLFQFQSE